MKFGPAGNSISFNERKNHKLYDVPSYLSEFGLNAFEYQCGRGVKISNESAHMFGKICAEYNIAVSIHAPYYISLSSVNDETRLRSSEYIMQSAEAVKYMGGNRVILHSGSCAKLDRNTALELAQNTLSYCIANLDAAGYNDIHLCPETMGKMNQLGSPDEVNELCSIDERLLPCYDFGHINCRTVGWIKGKEEYLELLNNIESRLGIDRLRSMHIHFSKIEYTQGGEKRHLTFSDTFFGPEYEPLLDMLIKKNADPVIICESDGTQAEDAETMKKYVEKHEIDKK